MSRLKVLRGQEQWDGLGILGKAGYVLAAIIFVPILWLLSDVVGLIACMIRHLQWKKKFKKWEAKNG